MLTCYDRFIGIRETCEAENYTPKSRLYIDDLPGLNVKRAAEVTGSGTGYALIEKCIKNACDETLEEALSYSVRDGAVPLLQTNQTGRLYLQNKFNKSVLVSLSGEKGIDLELKRPDFYQLSQIKIERIFIKCTDAINGATVKIIDGDEVTTLSGVDLEAGKRLEIDEANDALPYYAKTSKVRVVVNHDEGDFYQAYVPKTGCESCGSAARVGGFYDDQTSLFVSGGYGVSLDAKINCDIDRVKCLLLNELRYAVRYKAGVNLALESEFSDRATFWAFSGEHEKIKEYYQVEYDTALRRVIPSVSRLLKMQDKNCFECGGMRKVRIDI